MLRDFERTIPVKNNRYDLKVKTITCVDIHTTSSKLFDIMCPILKVAIFKLTYLDKLP